VISDQSRPRNADHGSLITYSLTSRLDNSEAQDDNSFPVSALFFKRFLKRPFQIASIVPSSKALVERVASKIDFGGPRVIAEYGPGEGVHSREIARRMSPDSHLLLFELDAAFSRALERQFAADPRVHVIHGDAASLPFELKRRGIPCCDYILSGIPFSILKIEKKRALLRKTYDALKSGGSFIIYQVTNELKQHATVFERAKSEYFLQNIPPMFITVFHKTPLLQGRGQRVAGKFSGLVGVGADRSA
jgi:phosphatidylethanolamine/phosphatidyl-N-methylethanolamine N-methyltransferase